DLPDPLEGLLVSLCVGVLFHASHDDNRVLSMSTPSCLRDLAAMTASERAGLTPSQRDWLRVHTYMNASRYGLAVRAAGEYPAQARVAGTPLLASPAWRPAVPLPLDSIRLEFRSPPDPCWRGGTGANDPDVASIAPDVASIAPDLLPVRPDGT